MKCFPIILIVFLLSSCSTHYLATGFLPENGKLPIQTETVLLVNRNILTLTSTVPIKSGSVRGPNFGEFELKKFVTKNLEKNIKDRWQEVRGIETIITHEDLMGIENFPRSPSSKEIQESAALFNANAVFVIEKIDIEGDHYFSGTFTRSESTDKEGNTNIQNHPNYNTDTTMEISFSLFDGTTGELIQKRTIKDSENRNSSSRHQNDGEDTIFIVATMMLNKAILEHGDSLAGIY